MKSKLLIAVSCLLVGAAGMFLIMSSRSAVVKAECPGPPGTPCGNGDVNADGYIDISDATYLLWYLFGDYPEPAAISDGGAALPATGQTLCYDLEGNVIDCASPDYPGQDAFYQAGCAMEGRFVDNGDGTVTDTCTGLMWQKETAPGTYSWQQALQYCENLTLAGRGDWRLPNIRELLSILDYGRHEPAIDPVFGAESAWYWSSSTYVYGPHFASIVYFWSGHVYAGSKGVWYYVRAVRFGP